MKLTIVGSKPKDRTSVINVRLHKECETAWVLYLNDIHVISVRLLDERTGVLSNMCSGCKILHLQQARKSRGISISERHCPKAILSILTGNTEENMKTLVHAFECFQKIYKDNGGNYAFSVDIFENMLNRFFFYPYIIPRMGKGADLMHYFMDLPLEYFE